MSHPPLDSAEIERRLMRLSQQQCRILYRVCHGKKLHQVAAELNLGESTIWKEMGAIYRLFGFTELGKHDKRLLLENTICPIHESLMTDAETDCAHRPIRLTEPPPSTDPNATALVKADVQSELYPLEPTRSLIILNRGVGLPRDDGKWPPYPPPPKKSPTLLLPAPQTIILTTAVVLMGATIVVLLFAALLFVARQNKPTTVAVSTNTAVPSVVRIQTLTSVPAPIPIVTVVTPPPPIVVTATPRADQQDPQPGSIISAGQGFTLSGVTITLLKPVNFDNDIFSFNVRVENNSSEQTLVRWKNSFVHVRDDQGKIYRQSNQAANDWDQLKQFAVGSGSKVEIHPWYMSWYTGADLFDHFQGKIDPSVKYLVITIDQMAGMTNMNWRYDLLPGATK